MRYLMMGLLLASFSLINNTMPKVRAAERGEVTVVADLSYVEESADPKQKLDLYLPTGKKNFPVVMFVHGGGYQKGDRKEAEDFGKLLASHGIGVAAISYRLYPQVKHPEHIQDVARAFAWVKKHIAERGGAANQVFVSGHSAGAHLVALLATDKKYVQGEKLQLADIRGVIALSGGYRILPIRKIVFGDEETMKDASPFSHLGKGKPPFLIVYGGAENQERHALSEELRDALKKEGNVATCVEIPERDHHGLFTKIAEGEPTLEAILGFVRQTSESAQEGS